MKCLLLFVAVASAQYHQKCGQDADCEGYCMDGTCRPHVQQGDFCNLYRKCKGDAICRGNICQDNTCEASHQCEQGYCNMDTKLCVPLKLVGESCDDATSCEEGLACKHFVCEPEIGCGHDNDCESAEYCDRGSRQCHTKACTYDSDCSQSYYCSEDAAECSPRPELGETCGGMPFIPCHEHLKCDARTQQCVDPIYNRACEDLGDSCDSCTNLGFRRCAWSNGQCQVGNCEGLEGCVSVPTACHATSGLPTGKRFSFVSPACSRDLDCDRTEFCFGGSPVAPKTGKCMSFAQEGQICGGDPQVECAQGFSCVVDSFHLERGICIANGATGFAKARPTETAAAVSSTPSNPATKVEVNEEPGYVDNSDPLLYMGPSLPVAPAPAGGLYHPASQGCLGCRDGISTASCPDPAACGFLPIAAAATTTVATRPTATTTFATRAAPATFSTRAAPSTFSAAFAAPRATPTLPFGFQSFQGNGRPALSSFGSAPVRYSGASAARPSFFGGAASRPAASFVGAAALGGRVYG